jgi:transcriptional regulator with XRE-family HTH domain
MTKDLGSQAEVARTLGVSRSRISRWLKDEEPDLVNLRKLEGVEFIFARLLQTFEPSTARKWLTGVNAHLGDRRPVDLLRQGRVRDVLVAIEAEETGAYA